MRKHCVFSVLSVSLMMAFIALIAFNTKVAEAQVGQEGLVMYYSFDAGTVQGGEVKDLAGPNDGVIKGDVQVGPGKIGDGMVFAGAATDYISVKEHNYNAVDIAGITIAAWIKTDTNGMIASWDRSEFFRFGAGDDQLGNTTKVAWDTCCPIHDFQGEAEITDGQWHHVAATYDSTAGLKNIYVDGALDATADAHGPGTPMGKVVVRYGFIGIGSEATEFDGGTGPTWAFNGTMDEFVLFDRALSEAEIGLLFSGGITSVAPAGKLSLTWGEVKAQH